MKEYSTRSRPEIPFPDYQDPKELYAFFGLAAYCAQLVEQGIVNLLVGLRIQGKESSTWAEIQSLYEQADHMVLGRLLKASRELLSLDSQLEIELEKALEKRNYLMHHFFVEHAEDLLSEKGKRGMIDELRDVIVLLKSVDHEVHQLWHAVWNKYGITEEQMERELETIKRLAR